MFKINLAKLKKSRCNALIFLLTFIVFGNGINNEYAIDDNIVVDGVKKVENGFKSIPKIFTTYYANDSKQNYGYRPLVLMTFAIEKQFFGKLPAFQTQEEKEKKDKLTQANISHLINVLLYAISCCVLFSFLLVLFNEYNYFIPLLITILFIIHPIHTEVVDNIKSRDEILVFLFLLLSMSYFLKYHIEKKIKYVLFMVLFIFFSVMTKKNGMVVIALLPTIAYFKGFLKIKKLVIPIIGFLAAMVLVKYLKNFVVVGEEYRYVKFFENPLLYVGGFSERLAMGFYCSLHYLGKLVFPLKMAFYYGYSHIPIVNWANWQVWVAILIYVPLTIYGIILFLKRQILGLGIVLWVGLMFPLINIMFPIVGIVADRFAYTFSLGFCIVLAIILIKAFKIDLSKEVINLSLPKSFISVFVLIFIAYSARTIARNGDWENYLHLYQNDIEYVENSAKGHALISNTLYPKVVKASKGRYNQAELMQDVDDIIYHYKRAVDIDSTYATSWNNLGSAYLNFKRDYKRGVEYCLKAIQLDTNYYEAHYNLAYGYGQLNNYAKTAFHTEKLIMIDKNNLRSYDFFNRYISNSKYKKEGIDFYLRMLDNYGESKNIYLSLANLYSLQGESYFAESLKYFEKGFEMDNSDRKLEEHIKNLKFKLQEVEQN